MLFLAKIQQLNHGLVPHPTARLQAVASLHAAVKYLIEPAGGANQESSSSHITQIRACVSSPLHKDLLTSSISIYFFISLLSR